jgi:CHASE3 domain sensor protein
MSDNNQRPIAGFFASILNLVLVLIVLNVVYIYAKTKNETGKEVNVTQVVVQQTRQLYDDVKTGWTSAEKDTIK